MRHALLAALLVAAGPALAQPPAGERLREELERAAEALAQSMGRVMSALQDAAREMPRYEMPELLENGDIIMRRKPPESAGKRRGEKTI